MSMGGGSQKSQTTPQTQPGAYGAYDYGESKRLGGMMEEMMKKPLYWEELLKGEMTNPQYGASTQSEQNLLNSLTSQTHGAATLRGLGSATPATLANVLAPTLIDFRQKRIDNLMKALGGEAQMKGVNYASLLDLIRQATPRLASETKSSGYNVSG